MNKPLKILYADDNAEDRSLFCNALKEIDPEIDCHTIEDGDAALHWLKQNTIPDYIFLDLRMPKMNGTKVLLEIRADSKFDQVPVIIYTTSEDVEYSKDLLLAGANHFVTKPANPEEIYYLISMVLSEKWT